MVAAINDTPYDIVYLLHIIAVILGTGAAFVVPFVAGRARRAGADIAAFDDAIASILELDEQSKGPKNYWAVIFAVGDLGATIKAITNSGGSVLMHPAPGLDFAMATDNQGAMFCVSDQTLQT